MHVYTLRRIFNATVGNNNKQERKKSMSRAKEGTDLAGVICEHTMRFAADFSTRIPKDKLDCGRLAELLKSEVKAGYTTLLAELKEAEGAFFGNEQMLNNVLNVGCAKFAADAVAKLKAESEVAA